jgi:carboxylesterase
MSPKTIPTAEPFFFPGNRIGCLLVHGYTGTPKEMRWMGEYLAAEGFTVLGVRLAGHATQPEDMARCRWQDWMASVEDGWHMLRGSTDYIFVIGLSMGGVLSLLLGSRFPVSGIITMATPSTIPQPAYIRALVPLFPLLSFFMPYRKKKEEDVWFNPELNDYHVSYAKNPVRPAYELNKLQVEMRASLAKITAPSLLIYSRDDQTVPLEHMQDLDALLVSEIKEKLIIQDTSHVITEDGDRERVFRATVVFIRKVMDTA